MVAALALGASPASAQKILLQIKPHVGDTIKTHLTQTLEMSGTRSRQRGDSAKTMTLTMEVVSRAIPFQWTSGGTLIHAITDSITYTPAGSRTSREERSARPVIPAPAVLRVASDGAIEFVDDGDPQSDMRHLFAEMPSVLPRKPVAVGDRWTKEMPIPVGGYEPADRAMKATLQFDSLSRTGEIAFISIRGTIAESGEAHRAITGATRTTGTFTGSIQLNRALGWITDTRSVITLRSEIPDDAMMPPQKSGRPVNVQTRVKVWSRAVKQR
jgi:hypothetical protein